MSPFSKYAGELHVALLHITALVSGNPEHCDIISGVKGWELVESRV